MEKHESFICRRYAILYFGAFRDIKTDPLFLQRNNSWGSHSTANSTTLKDFVLTLFLSTYSAKEVAHNS